MTKTPARHGRSLQIETAVIAMEVLQKRSAAKAVRSIGACIFLFLAGAASGSESIVISPGDCNSGVHLVARGARLSNVLDRLADTLGFELQLADSSDSIVDVDVSKQAPELVANISPVDNLVVAYVRSVDCPGRDRIVKVWTLPNANRAPPRTVDASPMPRQLTEAEKKLARDGEEMYRRAHGMPPAGDEGETAK